MALDSMAGNVDAGTGNVDRPDTGGTYISEVMQMPGISAYNTLYWNETLPGGTDVYFQLRGGATEAACTVAAWDATQYTTPAGSDISSETAYEYTQYKITMSTDAITETPTVHYDYGYTVKISYDILASDMETSIPIEWESGYTDFGYPGYKKTLRTVHCWHEGSSGDLILTFTTDDNISDTFTIDLANDSTCYTERFTDGALTGQEVKLGITDDTGVSALKIQKVLVVYDVEPLV